MTKGTSLIEKEAAIEIKEKEFFERQEKIKETEVLISRHAVETQKNYDTSENLRTEAQKLKEQTERECTNRYNELANRERNLSYKEHDLLLEKEQIENIKKDIENEKTHIASQQETLRKAWISIKNLQK